jgi:pyruvate/2-oxoglutarate dehydrogenase complex dihydrolipoamide acyltransferase (E2) component
MPKAGNSVEECILSKWRIKVGDKISTGQMIADIETDKSAIEVEATAEGTVLALFCNEGDLIPAKISQRWLRMAQNPKRKRNRHQQRKQAPHLRPQWLQLLQQLLRWTMLR